MIIYDYASNPVSITLPDKEIEEIFVCVESGDEIVHITFSDGERETYDSSDSRIVPFDDWCYSVTGQMIKKWMDFQPTPGKTASYERKRWFEENYNVIDSELVTEPLQIGGPSNA